ncbi:MAG: NADPH:quinone reductase [Burkholderiales bacterium]|nr:MAG: NADPH:quinone reductase [Burkholderiales bacterium]
MRAVIYERTGPAAEVLRLVELPEPQPGPGEVRVKISCSGVNPSDVKGRAGRRDRPMPFARIVPHSDGAGVIDRVGDGVHASRIGERVWLWNAAWGRPDGTAAEYVSLPSAQAVTLPAGIDMSVGACLGIPALTALHAVSIDGGVNGRTVLVAGGAGAVGHYAIQFARLKGARTVIASVSNAQKGALASEAGADLVVDYRVGDLAAAVEAATEGVGADRIIEVDLAANIGLDLTAVRQDGDIVVYGSGAPEIPVPFYPAIVKNVRMHFFIVYNLSGDDRARAVATLETLLEQNALIHNVAARLPLERIAEAHEMVETGRAVGNVVLDLG